MGTIITFNQIETTIKQLKQEGKKIILTGGCFDILHPGHIEFLSEAKRLDGFLVVLLESDESVQRLKGEGRPVHVQHDRAYVLSYLHPVDIVILLPQLSSNEEYDSLITTISPDYIAITKNDPVKKYVELQAQKVQAKLVEVLERKPYATSSITKSLNI
jgi:rfaE bifunctional protein nucleotidyltransferase chain/domain